MDPWIQALCEWRSWSKNSLVTLFCSSQSEKLCCQFRVCPCLWALIRHQIVRGKTLHGWYKHFTFLSNISFFWDIPAVFDWLCPLWASVSSLIPLWKCILKSRLSGFFSIFFITDTHCLLAFMVSCCLARVASFFNCESASSKLKYNRSLQMIRV